MTSSPQPQPMQRTEADPVEVRREASTMRDARPPSALVTSPGSEHAPFRFRTVLGLLSSFPLPARQLTGRGRAWNRRESPTKRPNSPAASKSTSRRQQLALPRRLLGEAIFRHIPTGSTRSSAPLTGGSSGSPRRSGPVWIRASRPSKFTRSGHGRGSASTSTAIPAMSAGAPAPLPQSWISSRRFWQEGRAGLWCPEIGFSHDWNRAPGRKGVQCSSWSRVSRVPPTIGRPPSVR